MSDLADLSNPKDFFLRTSLYRGLQWEEHLNDRQVKAIIAFTGPLDAFCPECQQDSIFKTILAEGDKEEQLSHSIEELRAKPAVPAVKPSGPLRFVLTETPLDALTVSNGQIVQWKFHCTRNAQHTFEVWARVAVNHKEVLLHTSQDGSKAFRRVSWGFLTKVGQYPSTADLYGQGAKKYKKLLGTSYSNFTRGLGLYAHGVGVGSFVYLRRIFENLIDEVHNRRKSEQDWNETDYQQRRRNERIEMLRESLPEFLVKNTKIYSILSKGIHELSEEECLKYFPLVQMGIELILDEKLASLELEAKKAIAEKDIAAVSGILK